MWRLRGIDLVSESGPVKLGYIELGDVTVFVGPNDSGKTRVLRAIEGAFHDADESREVLDLFGVAPWNDVKALVDPDPEEGDTEDIGSEAGPVQAFRSALELPLPDDEVPPGSAQSPTSIGSRLGGTEDRLLSCRMTSARRLATAFTSALRFR